MYGNKDRYSVTYFYELRQGGCRVGCPSAFWKRLQHSIGPTEMFFQQVHGMPV